MDLNDKQEEAVLYTNGPLLVQAGPGSGKTHVIIERVLHLVDSGAAPESILCMTFTEKATDEMSRRLHERDVDGVTVNTMHALCFEILKENSPTTGITEKTAMFSEIAMVAWCVRNIDKFGIDPDAINLEKGRAQQCNKMLQAIRGAKRELISAEDLEKYVDAAEPANSAEKKKIAQLAELAKVYRAYEAHKKENDLIDYEDMVAMAVEHLSRDGSMLEAYRKRYRHVLVDEFQDNNYAQFLLATLLAGEGNITAVGDGDQSIMGFQGAFGGIFEEFGMKYPNEKSVVLDQNYRCTENISELSSRLLRADEDRQVKQIHAVRDGGEPVVVSTVANEAAEHEFVAKTISELGVQHSDVAVLCSTNKSCQDFASALRSHGIPSVVAGIGGLKHNPAVAEVMSLIRIADSPQTAGMYVSDVLKRRGIGEHTIRAINEEAKRSVADDTPVDGVFAALTGYSGSDHVKVREIAARLQKMSDEAGGANLLETLHRIMMEYSDVYKKNANSDGYEAAKNLASLDRLYGIAEDYQTHYHDRRLSDFVDYLDMANRLDMTDLETEGAKVQDAVSVMTIHKSKGKEFDVVFVTGLHDDDFPGRPRPQGFAIPQELLKGTGRAHDPETAHVRDKRNVLYVAMTRAKDRLYLTYPRQAKTSNKEREPSRFLFDMEYDNNPRVRVTEHVADAQVAPSLPSAMAAEKSRIQENACRGVYECRPQAVVRDMVVLSKILHMEGDGDGDFDPRAILDVDLEGLVLPPSPKVPLISKDGLKLSASKIGAYQKCPLRFKYQHVLSVPSGHSIALKKGNAVHGALDWIVKERMAGHEGGIGDAKKMARDEMASVRNMHENEAYERAESSLDRIMDRYAEWESESPNNVVETEVEFTTYMDGIMYKGLIDRVERNADGRYEIVDFKTGASVIKPEAVETDPQLNIYAHAAKERYDSLPAKASLVYLEKTKKTKREYAVTDESLAAGIAAVKECAKDIVDEKFDATPEYDTCRSCPYKSICPDAAMR